MTFLKRGGDTVCHKKLWRKGKEGENPEPSYLWVNEQQQQQQRQRQTQKQTEARAVADMEFDKFLQIEY